MPVLDTWYCCRVLARNSCRVCWWARPCTSVHVTILSVSVFRSLWEYALRSMAVHYRKHGRCRWLCCCLLLNVDLLTLDRCTTVHGRIVAMLHLKQLSKSSIPCLLCRFSPLFTPRPKNCNYQQRKINHDKSKLKAWFWVKSGWEWVCKTCAIIGTWKVLFQTSYLGKKRLKSLISFCIFRYGVLWEGFIWISFK